MSAIRPHSKRERSRSSSVGISLGRASEVTHDLLLRVVERVEGVEELLLGRVLAGDELDVVHQEHVELAVAPLELVHALEAQRVDELVQEALGREVQDVRSGLRRRISCAIACIRWVLPRPTPP